MREDGGQAADEEVAARAVEVVREGFPSTSVIGARSSVALNYIIRERPARRGQNVLFAERVIRFPARTRRSRLHSLRFALRIFSRGVARCSKMRKTNPSSVIHAEARLFTRGYPFDGKGRRTKTKINRRVEIERR